VNRSPDLPGSLLTFAAQRIRPERSEWGAAMLAELTEVTDPVARWQFALGCMWIALFAPGTGGLLQMRKNTIVTAALISTLIVAPFLYLELRNRPLGALNFPYPLFVLLWVLPAAFVFTAAPIVRSVRAGQNLLAHPILFLTRVTFLVLAALFWSVLINDQMPCFLGVPNCD
jgi:hypothetical protein